jgi:predicted nucleic acid-binding Zn ribbon protein
MPIYAYRCTCGKIADVLVRGAEPTCCDDVPELSGTCASPGKLVKLLSAPYVGRASGGGASAPADTGSCGHCGMTPGSCGTDN